MDLPPSSTASLQTTASRLLNVRNGVEGIKFYKAAFSVREISGIGDAETGLRTSPHTTQTSAPESLGGSSLRMVLTSANPDAIFDRAVAAGATIVAPVEDQVYGWRVGRVLDPFGHHGEIGKPLT